MITLEALVMVLLAAIAVYIAYTKCNCQSEDARITWIPDAADGSAGEAFSEANPAQLHR